MCAGGWRLTGIAEAVPVLVAVSVELTQTAHVDLVLQRVVSKPVRRGEGLYMCSSGQGGDSSATCSTALTCLLSSAAH